MADSVNVNFDAVELANALLLFRTREEYTRAVSYGEIEDKTLAKATEFWGASSEDIYLDFLLLYEGIIILQEEVLGRDGALHGNQRACSKHNELGSNEREKMLENDDSTKQKRKFYQKLQCFSSGAKKYSSKKNSAEKKPSDQEIEMTSVSRIHKSNERSLKDDVDQQGSIDGQDFFNNGFHVTVCEPELDLTTTEDEDDCSHVRRSVESVSRPNRLKHLDSAINGRKNLITHPRYLEAKSKFKEAERRLKMLSLDQRQISLSNKLRFLRLAIVCSILMSVDNPKLGLDDCKNLIGRLNSLISVRNLVTKALEPPSGLRRRLSKKLNGKRWKRTLEKVHFINYVVWQWLMLGRNQPGTGTELEIPCIETGLGFVHPTDDWRLRDKYQTCVEFEHLMPHSCTLAVNSKDQLILIDAGNNIVTYTIEGKHLMSFRASTKRHPHSRWIIGLDEKDQIYVGSTLGIRYDTKRPLSVFSPAGILISEPELRGFRGQFHLYTVTKRGMILILAVGTPLGNMVSVHRPRDNKLINSFPVREVEFPRNFTTGKDTIIVGGTATKDPKEFAFQIFDQYGQQLFFFKPEVEFQNCAVDPWSGNIVVVNVNTERDYRYYTCNTVILTGEIHVLAPNGEIIRSSVKLRWPFRVVAGVTVLRCGMVALVTVDGPYYAIHVI